MREFCLTEEILQQFVDGELSPERSESTAAHLSSCDACAELLGEVEHENHLLSEAFAPELSLSVPTQSLRERLDSAIADLNPGPARALVSERASSSRLSNWWRALASSLIPTPQRGLAFASLAVVIVFATIFAVIQLRQGRNTPGPIADKQGDRQVFPGPAATETKDIPGPSKEDDPAQAIAQSPTPGQAPERDVQRPTLKVRPKQNVVAVKKGPEKQVPNALSAPKLLPGERSYLEAIASLTTAIEQGGDETLKPTVRADLERNLAVVDQAIASTRSEAKRNPNDRYAAEFMYTAYQNKIELLSAVAEQTRVASR